MNQEAPFYGEGPLIYDPRRPGLKRRKDWWVVVPVDNEIARYYRWWVQRRYHIALCEPSWKAHISVVRGEMPREASLRALWKKHAGERVRFAYGHNPKLATARVYAADDGQIWFIDAYSDRLCEIRAELGLPTFHKFHISIGKTYY